jgi:hypothetical protein
MNESVQEQTVKTVIHRSRRGNKEEYQISSTDNEQEDED